MSADIETPAVIPTSVLDGILTAQLAVAWAGEKGEEPRLGWWRTDLKSEFGGEDFFKRLLPATWEWAIFQGMREAAVRADAALRNEHHDAEEIITLYSFGFETDELVNERLMDLKRSGVTPLEALTGLKEVVADDWNESEFVEWLSGHGKADFTKAPAGRRLKGAAPQSLELIVSNLLAALTPIADAYPLPHYQRKK
jgi:hypothetical protein